MRSKLPPNESVGDEFSETKLILARDKTLELINAAAKQMKPGTNEAQAKDIINALQLEFGAERTWHPPQIRFGENTLLPFGVPGRKNQSLKDNDIFFFDLGPVFSGHEGDVGRPFVLGDDSEMLKCAKDVEKIWHQVQEHWQNTQISGAELYAFATERSKELGWQLAVKKANGHRISDFPHAAQIRGSIEGWGSKPKSNRWILEIQIHHPSRQFGAFYEDLLSEVHCEFI